MNNKGQAIFVTLMIAAVIMLLVMALAPAINDFTQDARNASTTDSIGLDCNNSSISNFDQATCVTTDLFLPYFFGGILGIAGIIIGARLVFGGGT